MVRFRVLGGVAAYGERGEIALGTARQRAVLAVLLVAPGAVVMADQLADRVWGETAPKRSRETLHSYVSRLRGALGASVLVRRAGGYAVDADASAVDVYEFRALVARARAAGDGEDVLGLWRDAMEVWRGEPFAGLESDWLRQAAVGWESERWAALLDFREVRLARGEHAQLLPELTAEADANPLDERVAGQLMAALYRCGRQADALARFRLLRERFVAELGSDPGAELRELHQRILRQELDLAVTVPQAPAPEAPAANGAPVAGGVVPAQLPADVAGFTGRADDLRRLDELMDGDGGRAVVITAIGGTAGVGKTALATHWSHRVADRFPDGQLYVNLRGYDPGQPMDPADALARFLAALGVSGQDVPVGLDERATRFRSEVAGRRMLVVLDNAGSVGQVRPLLPGSGSSLVVVTSRDSLAGLVAVDGAHRVDLGLLSAGEAVDLLRRLVGDRVEAEPEVAAELAEQCVRLPLALRVAAELAVSRPDESLADLVAELADRQARLALLDAGEDPRAAVREVLSWSLQQLPDDTVRMFRLLGLHPGPDFDAYAAAALAGAGPELARRLLERLARANLVHRTGGLVRGRGDRRGRGLERAGEVGGIGLGRGGRYGMHDLLRAYAIELAGAEETDQFAKSVASAPAPPDLPGAGAGRNPSGPGPGERQAAEERLFGYYQAAAVAAMEILYPAESRYWPDVPASAATIPDLGAPGAARDWLDAERSCLVATVAHAAAIGNVSYASGTPQIVNRYLNDAHLADQLAMNRHALRATEAAGDIAGQACALRLLAGGYNHLGQHERAVELAQQALARSREANDLIGEALTLSALGIARYRLGEHKQAIDDDVQAVAVFRRAGDRLGEAGALLNLAVDEEQHGRYAEAADYSRQALGIFRELGSRYYEGLVLNNLGNTEMLLGEHDAAGEHLRQSLAILQQVGSPITIAHVLDSLGNLYVHYGDEESAVSHFQQALTLYREIGDKTGQAWAMNGLGEAARLAGQPADSLQHHTEALALAVETRTRPQEARAHTGIGHAHRALGDHDRSQAHFELAYALYVELEMRNAEDIRPYLDPPSSE